MHHLHCIPILRLQIQYKKHLSSIIFQKHLQSKTINYFLLTDVYLLLSHYCRSYTYPHQSVQCRDAVVRLLQHDVNVLGAVQKEKRWLLGSDAVAHDGPQTTLVCFQEPHGYSELRFFVKVQKLFNFQVAVAVKSGIPFLG